MKTLIDNLPGIVYRCANDRDWTMEFLSKGCYELLGYHSEDLIQNKKVSYGSLIEKSDRKYVHSEIQKAIKQHKSFILKYRIRTASDQLKWVWEQGIGIFSNNGELEALEGYITEITETGALEQEAKYRLLIENINDGVVISQYDKFIFFNNQFAKMLGYTVNELLMKDYRDVYTERGLKILQERSARRDHREAVSSQYETVFKKKNGAEIEVGANVAIIDYKGDKATFAVIRDISERKKVEKEIHAQKQYFEALFTSSTGAIVSLDMKERVVNINLQFEKLFGYHLEDIIGKKIDNIIVPKKLIKEARKVTKLVQRGGIAVKETKRLRKDGTLIDISIGGAPIIVDGKQIGMFCVYMDITDMKKAEEEIRTQKQYFEALFNSTADAIVSLDLDHCIVNINTQFETMFGYKLDEIKGKNVDAVVVPKEKRNEAKKITNLVEQGGIALSENKRQRKNGTLVDVSIGGAPIIAGEKQIGILATYRDITERKKAEEERERIILKLQEALNRVNTLSGLIPICAGCKKIRDDQGYWSDVELYISKHSEAEFSHGLCNDCMEKLA
ncbi:MAG: PAS domain S-box protein [Candidatus Marinimicrobia bacterium]|nr:PAS domain S-box protein [Candidatus Neomarinimicrobiota bacterium]